MKRLLWVLALATMALLPAAQAEALNITPATATVATGDQTSQAQINTAIAGILGSAVELYKQNVGPDGEVGSLAGSYETTFANSPGDPQDATITYVGGPIVGPTAYLLVKDGNQSPAWYLFNLTDLGWNGTETLNITGFWPGNGAISHVALYGTAVPEPGTLSLLAVGLVGAGVLRRRQRPVA